MGDYYEVRSGLSKPASEFGSGFPFLSFKNVFNNYFLPDDLEELVNTSESERENMSIKKGDVFLTRTSETNDELGMSSVALKDYPNATFNGFCKRLRPKESNDFDPKYIGFYLRSPKFRAEIGQFANLTTRASLNNEIINRLNLIVLPLETQKKIASILSGYDDLIENNLKRIKILEEMAQQTYEEWFVRMRFPGHESATINAETGLPEGWEKVKCFDAMEVLSGGTPKTDIDEYWSGNIEFFTPKDAKSGSYTNGTEKHITDLGLKKCNSKLYPKDTVFITARGTVGKLNLAAEPMAMNQSCYALKGKGIISQYFLFCSMNSIIESFKSASNGGVFNTIVVDTFKFLDYIMPTEELIIQFEKIVTPIYKSILNLQNQNQRLREARDILLPRLMMGMIEV